jgi:hypothetical protein
VLKAVVGESKRSASTGTHLLRGFDIGRAWPVNGEVPADWLRNRRSRFDFRIARRAFSAWAGESPRQLDPPVALL